MMRQSLDIEVRIKSLDLSDGSQLLLEKSDALLIVGPNNAGKSQFLRDIEALSKRSHGTFYNGKVVRGLEFLAPLNSSIYNALQPFRINGTDNYSANGVTVHQNYIHNAFALGQLEFRFGEAAHFFVKRVSSDDRLSIVAPSPAMPEEGPSTPGQLLYDDEILVERVSAIFYKAFAKDVFLNYRSGANIPLHVGIRPSVPKGLDRISNEYVDLVKACDKLHEQGDGMKSFGGIVLSTMVRKFNITLIDEPEAFLHPPQERVVGKVIAQETYGQVICSTHSKNVLQGFLESGRKDIRVARITRDGSVNRVSEISAAEIGSLWKDPVFRYSTALDALFHSRAVLCEAEPDCRFYEAIENHLFSESVVDSHFIPCAGKAAFPKFSKALKKLGVNVVAILDLDVLNDETTIKNIFEAQGGNWTEIAKLWRRLDAAVRGGIKTDDAETTKEKVIQALDEWKDGPPPTSTISDIMNQRKPWGTLKNGGLDALPAGEAQRTAEELIGALAVHHVFPIPVGTMEMFVKAVGNKGNKWLASVFETYGLDDERLERARRFVATALKP